jgi:hypothetical protein
MIYDLFIKFSLFIVIKFEIYFLIGNRVLAERFCKEQLTMAVQRQRRHFC